MVSPFAVISVAFLIGTVILIGSNNRTLRKDIEAERLFMNKNTIERKGLIKECKDEVKKKEQAYYDAKGALTKAKGAQAQEQKNLYSTIKQNKANLNLKNQDVKRLQTELDKANKQVASMEAQLKEAKTKNKAGKNTKNKASKLTKKEKETEAKAEADKKAKKEEEEKAKKAEEEKAKKAEEEEKAKKAEEEKAKKSKEEKAKKAEEEKAKKAEEEKAKKAAEEKAKKPK